MPITSTPKIRPLSPGLARNAPRSACRAGPRASAHRTRNTSIRTRKMRGEESLNGSRSCAMISAPHSPDNKAAARRKEEPWAAAGRTSLVAPGLPPDEPAMQGAVLPADRAGGRRAPPAASVFEAAERSGRRDHAFRRALNRRSSSRWIFSLPARILPFLNMSSPPVEIADKAAGLAHERDARRHVPGREVALPIGIETAGGDPGEIERGRAEAAQPGDLVLHRAVLTARQLEVAAAGMRQPAGHHGVGKPPARRHPQPLIVEESALAAFGGEQLVVCRIVDERRRRSCLPARARSRSRSAECRAGSSRCRRADRRSSDGSCRCLRVRPPSSPRKP